VGTDASQQDGAAARCEDYIRVSNEFTDDRRLALTEAGLTFEFEDYRNGDAEPALEFGIGIVELFLQPLGEQAAERRLAAPRHTHQKQIAPMQMHQGILAGCYSGRRNAGAAK
jgi:hypothetical protein